MITTILKQKYQNLLEEQHTVDPAEFIALISMEHNASPELVGKILENCEWFKLE